METQQVRYFVTVCDELSFTRAAQKCGVKQPSISEAIKRMERDVGGDLFLRTSPLQLTPLGSQLLPVCLQINRLVEEAQAITFSQQNSPSAESYRKDSAMSALTARLFPHASEASLSDIDTFVQIAIFCGIGLLLSLSVLILDQHVSGEWF